MANVPRKVVFQALFDLLKTMQTTLPDNMKFRYLGRHLLQWDQTPDQPAMFLVEGPMTATQGQSTPFLLTKWHYQASIWIYFKADQDAAVAQTLVPDDIIDDYIDAVDKVLEALPPGSYQTLGGKITHCWIDGPIVFDSAIEDPQCIIVIPLSLITGI